MKLKLAPIFIVLLAFTVFLGTVAPVTVFAQDMVQISNSVHTSSNTGGKNGQDGDDGQDGAPGRDGTNNASAGASVTNVVSGNEYHSDVSTSSVGGGAVIEERAFGFSSTEEANSHNASGTSLNKSAVATMSADDLSRLENILTELKSIILAYVKSIF